MVKALFAGDVNGAFASLLKRVEALHKKNQFDVLFCVGTFFAPGASDGDIPADLAPYISGEKHLPLPVYFIGGCGRGSKAALEAFAAAPPAGPDAPGVRYLGRSGVKEVAGLQVAFLDGTYMEHQFCTNPAEQGATCRYYTEADVALLRGALGGLAGEVDLLLTAQWPQGAAAGLEGYPPGAGSSIVSELADLARPRYHIAGGQGIFFTRAPYINKDLGAGARPTRFVGLAALDNPSKAKSLHALSLTPASDMTPEQLSARPDGATPSPYANLSRDGGRAGPSGKRPAGDEFAQDWRWQPGKKQRGAGGGPPAGPATPWGNPDVPKAPDCTVYVKNLPFAASYDEVVQFFSVAGKVVDIRRGVADNGRLQGWAHVQFASKDAVSAATRLNGEALMGRQLTVDVANAAQGGPAPSGKPVEGCWFCLSSPEVDIALVASVGEEVYLSLDKGPITPAHCLLIPVEHFPSWASLGAGAAAEVDAYLGALRAHAAAQGKAVVGFERHLALRSKGGNHAHINVLGVGKAAAADARQVFERQLAAAGVSSPTHLPPGPGGRPDRAALQQLVGRGEYWLALLPDGGLLVHPIARGERLPMDLGRACLAELAGAPQRADWKTCKAASPEEEAAATDAFKVAFGPYDPMQQS